MKKKTKKSWTDSGQQQYCQQKEVVRWDQRVVVYRLLKPEKTVNANRYQLQMFKPKDKLSLENGYGPEDAEK